MYKTFIQTFSVDNSWTGGDYYHNDNYLKDLDAEINQFCKENILTVKSVIFSMVTTGHERKNQTVVTTLFAAVVFE